MNILRPLVSLFFSLSILSSNVLAAESGQSELNTKSIWSKFGLNTWQRIDGPGLKNPLSDKRPDANGDRDPSSPIYWWQEYNLTYDAGVVDPFIRYNFALNAYNPNGGSIFASADPRAGIETGGFKVLDAGIGDIVISYIRADVTVPLTQASRDAGIIMAPSLEVDLDLPIRKSRFTLGTAYEYTHVVYKNDAPTTPPSSLADVAKDGKVWAMAFVKYQISDKVSTRFRYESNLYHAQGSLTQELISDGSKFRLRFDIDSVKNFSFRPFVAWNPRQNFGSSWYGMDISGVIF